jgi:hypothetical protein
MITRKKIKTPIIISLFIFMACTATVMTERAYFDAELLLRDLVEECAKREDTVIRLDATGRMIVEDTLESSEPCASLDIALRGAERGVGMCTGDNSTSKHRARLNGTRQAAQESRLSIHVKKHSPHPPCPQMWRCMLCTLGHASCRCCQRLNLMPTQRLVAISVHACIWRACTMSGWHLDQVHCT